MERNIRHLKKNPTMAGIYRLTPDIVYSAVCPESTRLSILHPWNAEEKTAPKPLIVFVQGSAWTTPDRNAEIPQLSEFARAGWIVATVGHRDCKKGNPFPCYLKDVKTAIRYLRANAEKYEIDPDRVVIWGTSSGGNTSLLVALTAGMPAFETEEYKDYSDEVLASVACFGPTDIESFLPEEAKQILRDRNDPEERMDIFRGLVGDQDADRVMHDMSPVNYIKGCGKIPPIYLLHGDDDPVVPYSQALEMYDALTEAGAEVEMTCVEGAPHEGSFWSRELLETIGTFLNKHI